MIAAGCATSPAAEKVRLERVSASVAFLEFRHQTEQNCTLVSSETLGDNGGPAARRNAREYAVKIGADVVIWREYDESPDKLSHADFYRCGR